MMHIPEGYKLVPVEPTAEQEELGCQSYMATDGKSTWVMHKSSMGHAYRAMIAAAPPVELPAYNEAKERAKFEAAYVAEADRQGKAFDSAVFTKDADGEYLIGLVQSAWWSWKACAQSRDGSVGDE